MIKVFDDELSHPDLNRGISVPKADDFPLVDGTIINKLKAEVIGLEPMPL